MLVKSLFERERFVGEDVRARIAKRDGDGQKVAAVYRIPPNFRIPLNFRISPICRSFSVCRFYVVKSRRRDRNDETVAARRVDEIDPIFFERRVCRRNVERRRNVDDRARLDRAVGVFAVPPSFDEASAANVKRSSARVMVVQIRRFERQFAAPARSAERF